MAASDPPLELFMENANGEEVSLSIEPEDDFQTFLTKAKSILGFDIDINSITRNQPMSLTDNIYRFLINTDQSLDPQNIQNFDQILEPNNDSNDLVYILDDGTQIRASQIQFDNEDPQLDLTTEKIPFIKYVEDDESENDNNEEGETINYKIQSPISRRSSNNASPEYSFVDTLPFKLVCNNVSAFEAQFTKYLENSVKTYTNLNNVTNKKSPISLIKDNYKNYEDTFNTDDITGYTREDILNMFKDTPVMPLPYEGHVFTEKRKRKSDPSRSVHKGWNSKPVSYDDAILIGDIENQNCFICGKFVENNLDKIYLFDNEDQKVHRAASPQRKSTRQIKVICEICLKENFRPCSMKGPNQCLSPDEYLVIRSNQQYIFQKIKEIDFKIQANSNKGTNLKHDKQKLEFVKVEIGSDGEIVTKPIDNEPRSSDDVIIVNDDVKDSSSDVEIIEPPVIDDIVIDNLEDADEEVKEFLGQYQQDGSGYTTELKCRFCERIFPELSEVMDHVEEHKHDLEEGVVYPCPICEYGYANSKWLKGHLKAAHEKANDDSKKENGIENSTGTNSTTNKESPIAKRTRSAVKKIDTDTEKGPDNEDGKPEEKVETTEPTIIFKTEVKQEAIDNSDDEIWIVQTGDEATEQIESLLNGVKNRGNEKEANSSSKKKMHKCFNCSRIFPSEESLSTHKCRRGRKRKSTSKEDSVICVPTEEDFLKRARGRPRADDQSDNSDIVLRPRRKRNKEPSSDPKIVTCHNCNESFTSKVRLKFHMQFHESTDQVTSDGQYKCTVCRRLLCSEAALFDHVHFHHDKQRRWQCPVRGCGKTFYLRATLTKHSRTHTDTRRYVCVTCGKRFLDKQTLDEHGVTHLQIKPFQCHICMKQLTRRSRLRMHMRAHEEELTPKLVLVCVVCSRAFRDHDEAQEHASKSAECIEEFAKELKKEEEEPTAQLSPTSGLVRQPAPVVESSKVAKSIPCQVASPLARPLLSCVGDEARAIVRVVEIEKVFRCEYCEDVFYLEDGLNTHRRIHKGVKNPFTCHICKVSFATYSRCTTHKTTHGFYKRPLAEAKRQASKPQEPEAGPSATGILGYGGFPVVKHFLCEDCGRSYLHWTYLQVHRRMKHATDNTLHKCTQCELTFPNSWSLAYHKKKIHLQPCQSDSGATTRAPRDVYRIPCRDCSEVLPNKTALYKHRQKEHSDMSLRENDVPDKFYCRECGKEHETRAELETHTRTHSNDAGLSRDKCGETFARPGNVQKHDSHLTHSCPVCGHAFRSPSIRDEHLRTHTGERPFPCDVCGVAFRRPTAMRNHRLIHTGVRSWACPRCPKRFRVRSDLRTHARLKHPANLLVIEIRGLNPSPDEVMQHLSANNVAQDKVIEITKISFPKGTSSIVPNSTRALTMLANIPRTQVAYSQPIATDVQPARRGRGIAKNPRQPKVLQRGDDTPQDAEDSGTLKVTDGDLKLSWIQ